jgi:hypothetical protein
MVEAEIEEFDVEKETPRTMLTWKPPRRPRLRQVSRLSLLPTLRTSRPRTPASSRTKSPRVAQIINLYEYIDVGTVE